MNSISVFGYSDYKKFLKAVIQAAEIRGFQSKLADAAHCQRAYFSRVLNGKAHLTLEQAFGISEQLGLNEAETNYFLDLVNYQKSSTDGLSSQLKRRLETAKSQQENLKNRYGTVHLSEPHKEGIYYSSWHWSAIHIIISIPKYQSPREIAKRLLLPESLVLDTLQTLASFGLVKEEAGKWKFSSGQLHLPKESMMTGMNHANWRHRAITSSQLPRSDGFHYTAVQSHSAKVFQEIRELLLRNVDQVRSLVAPSPDEEITSLCIDYFRV